MEQLEHTKLIAKLNKIARLQASDARFSMLLSVIFPLTGSLFAELYFDSVN